MGRPGAAEKARLICGMISARPALFDRAMERMAEAFGPVAFAGEPTPFDFTDYYEAEMGRNLLRRFCAFDGLFNPALLADVKRRTNDLERELAAAEAGVARPINLDPGYVTLAKLVLATTKDRAHRVYLRDGIWAEITLSYHDGAWNPMPWTYPDYRTDAYLAFFRRVRDHLSRQQAP